MPLILFVLSCLVLTLEVLETKIFAYSLENSLIFLVVGVVLLGFGSGGSVLSLRRELGDPRPVVRRNLLWTAVLLVVAHVVFAQFSDHLEFGFDLWTVFILLALAAPYFSAGMAISAILADPAGNVHARYGLNLLGSAVGCVGIFLVLGPLTGPEMLMACAIACGLLGAILCERKLPMVVGVLLVGAPLFVFADDFLPYRIQKWETAGQLALIEKNAADVVATNPDVQRIDLPQRFDRWDPTARVAVHGLEVETTDAGIRQSLDALPSMWFTQDSSYGSPLIGWNGEASKGVYERSCYAFGYFRGPGPQNVLVIGLGGTPDIQTALHQESQRITGVDINATTVRMAREDMADFLGRPYDDERITIHLRDGRSFVRGSAEKYDLIQLSGVDTKSVLASGTLALNESYLYTQEAFDEYIGHLKDDGVLCINYASETYRKRLAITAMDTLRRRGVADPTRHLMMVEQSKIFGLLVKPTPFTDAECWQMRSFLQAADAGDGQMDESTGIVVWVYELLSPHLSLMKAPKAIYLPDEEDPKDPVMKAARGGSETLAAFMAESDRELEPAPDWRPFFFNTVRNEDVLARFDYELKKLWPFGDKSELKGVAAAGTEQFARMFRLLWIMVGLSVVLILGPLFVLGTRGVAAWSTLPFALYFAALGAGYILAMSGLIQRYVLFLGHQAYAFAAVIGGLLVAAGVGSLVAGRYAQTPRKVMVTAVSTICLMLLVLQKGLDPLFGWTADLPLTGRIAVALCALFPLGAALGTMFPTGLGLVRQRSPLFVPWAFGINGVFSVIGTTIVLPGAILYGFPTMAVVAGGVYVLALLVGLPLARVRS
ncbi:MAG: hypothetical protein RL562_2510 [Planctomycetota bacterium]